MIIIKHNKKALIKKESMKKTLTNYMIVELIMNMMMKTLLV